MSEDRVLDLNHIKVLQATVREIMRDFQKRLNEGDYETEEDRLLLVGEIATFKQYGEQLKAVESQIVPWDEAIDIFRRALLSFELTLNRVEFAHEKDVVLKYRTESKFHAERLLKAVRTTESHIFDISEGEEYFITATVIISKGVLKEIRDLPKPKLRRPRKTTHKP